MTTRPDAEEENPGISPCRALRQEEGRETEVAEELTTEHPLQIVVNGRAFSMTMRTPGAERYLVRGLLHAEGICSDGFLSYEQAEMEDGTLVNVRIADQEHTDAPRTLASTSSCGICGRESTGRLFAGVHPVLREQEISAGDLERIHRNARGLQRTFQGTGGSHAASAATAGGEVLALFEDIGRHNAVDKVVGFLLESGLAEQADVLTVSGRISFEIVQKCARAGIPILSAISAPSSLAVESAGRWGITLAGFCREGRATFYSGFHRVRRSVTELPTG